MKKQFSEIEILEKICQTKLKKMQELGFSLGHKIPSKRNVPVIKPSILENKTESLIIAEIKRASPTKGHISTIQQPIELAQEYIHQGANAISVLCEEDFFKGSLQDLLEVKEQFPHICVLRKDFILHKEEILVSYLCGADIVLLIVSIFMDNMQEFIAIYQEILSYNLTPLIEVHDLKEWEKIANLDLNSAIIGINSRNLKTFRINKMDTLKLRARIPDNIPVIFESGIQATYDSFIAGSGGFQGILCGSFLVQTLDKKQDKKANTLQQLQCAFEHGKKETVLHRITKRFCEKNEVSSQIFSWDHVDFLMKKKIIQKPLIKVCGINNLAFLEAALQKADLLGFILVPQSPRHVDNNFLIQAHEKYLDFFKVKNQYRPIRVGIVKQEEILIGLEYIQKGYLDCLQLHNVDFSFCEQSNDIRNEVMPYKTLQAVQFKNLSFYPSVCFDFLENSVWSEKEIQLNTNFVLWDNSAGNAQTLNIQGIKKFLEFQPDFMSNLWLAGGINIDNLKEVLELQPMLIDICSGFESKRGVKDIDKMKLFFEKLNTFF